MSEDAEFAGRIVGIWAREPVQGGVMEDVRVRQLGSRTFLVGRLADQGKGSNTQTGLSYWIPVEEVLMLTVYPDLQAARAAYASREQQAAESNQSNQKGSTWWQWRK